jgi:hypothetical protein
MKSGAQFFQTELIMLVRTAHYSDYLEHDLCIQDEFTIPISSCIMSGQLVLSGMWQKLLRNIATGHSRSLPQRHVSMTLSYSACTKLENLFGNLCAVIFIHVTCDAVWDLKRSSPVDIRPYQWVQQYYISSEPGPS